MYNHNMFVVLTSTQNAAYLSIISPRGEWAVQIVGFQNGDQPFFYAHELLLCSSLWVQYGTIQYNTI